MKFMFSTQGRINRSKAWLGVLLQLLIGGVLAGFLTVLVYSGSSVAEDGSFSVSGAAALPYILPSLAYVVFLVWSTICLGVKRYHDRDKPGVWVLIQLVPVIGSLWYFIEVFCLAGSPGSNRFGLNANAAA